MFFFSKNPINVVSLFFDGADSEYDIFYCRLLLQLQIIGINLNNVTIIAVILRSSSRREAPS